MDFSPYFAQYERLVASAEKAFDTVRTQYPDQVQCTSKCSDCCHALFDVSLIEALYINHKFNAQFSGAEKHEILERANRADRKIYRIKRDAHKAQNGGATDVEILGMMAMERVRCPLLGQDDLCCLYDARPITCRLYGIPTATAGVSHTCGKSSFTEGEAYPTVQMEALHERLYLISKGLVDDIKSRYTKMSEMLVPLSMALLTDYNEDYLGLTPEKSEKEKA